MSSISTSIIVHNKGLWSQQSIGSWRAFYNFAGAPPRRIISIVNVQLLHAPIDYHANKTRCNMGITFSRDSDDDNDGNSTCWSCWQLIEGMLPIEISHALDLPIMVH